MALIIRPADGNDLVAVLSVGHRTWPLTYEPIAGRSEEHTSELQSH